MDIYSQMRNIKKVRMTMPTTAASPATMNGIEGHSHSGPQHSPPYPHLHSSSHPPPHPPPHPHSPPRPSYTSTKYSGLYGNRGLSGMANVGNSCYLNSCMQVLSHTYELNTFLDKQQYVNRINKNIDAVVLIKWDQLRKLLWDKNCNIIPGGFIKYIRQIATTKGRHIFTGFSQNDVQEFLLFIIDSFHLALSRRVNITISGTPANQRDVLAQACFNMMRDTYQTDYSEIVDLFYGIQVSQILEIGPGRPTTSGGGEMPVSSSGTGTGTGTAALSPTSSSATPRVLSAKPEPFMVLSLSITSYDGRVQYRSLSECLDAYCEVERMEGDNAWFNEETNSKQAVDKCTKFWKLPDVFIIDLKRWTMNRRKNHTAIEIPVSNADFSKYICGYCPESYKYELYGICNHYGSGMNGGHYTAYIRTANNQWYEFNDTYVHPLEVHEDNAESIHALTRNAYCLFYRKIKR